jgi:ferric-dicitrate binding protein FerR (iron transport regulator)
MSCGTNTEVATVANYEAVHLPDGSQVLLNHHSTISYKEEFSPRTINLSGEAFFTVLPGESAFIVTTQHGDVEVLGTEFNVKTTANQVVVDVKKGLVELKTAYHKSKIKKGIKAIYKDGEQEVQQIKSNREYRKWIRSLQKEFKKLGRDLKPVLKEIGNEFEKAGKKIGDEFKN